MVNAQALTETLAAVEKEVERGTGLWDQSDWAQQTPCGTAGCFAGWRAFLDGYTRLEDGPTTIYPRRLVNPRTGDSLPMYDDDGRPWPDDGTTVARHAQQRFGLEQNQAETLFAMNNTLHDLREIVAVLIGADEKSAGEDD
jgi:hypothetical protein